MTDQDAIIALLTRIYLDIVEIEGRFGLLAGEGDMRPRIDYFHDAVRAFSTGHDRARLQVERLAYDLQCLRYIQQMPLAPFKKGAQNLSPSQAVMSVDAALPASLTRPDRETRSQLVEHYQRYAVLFAALLKPAADYDYQDRTEMMNQEVEDLHALIHQFETKPDINIVAALAQQMEQPELRVILLTFLQQQKQKDKASVAKLLGHLKNGLKQKDQSIKQLDTAHGNFAMAQLGIFEASRDMLKKMAAQGMNLAGRFVENAMAETRRQMVR